MGTYSTIETLGLSKLNNAEYYNFISRVMALTDDAADAQFGIAEFKTEMTALMQTLKDILNRTAASAETAEMLAADTERDSCISYLTGMVRAAKNSPVAAHRDAYAKLEVVIRPYKGLARMRNQEETAVVKGLILDLGKEENAEPTSTLNLHEVIAALETANAKYEQLTAARSETRIAQTIADAKDVRGRLNDLYSDLTTRVAAVNIVTPSDASEAFIASHNQIAAETKTAYNQRVAERKEEKKPTDSDGGDGQSET